MIISIHAPTRGATFCSQNQHHAGKISIHAPTRGATFLCGCRARREIISIHAPTRGATQSQVTQLNSDLHFNPRSHKGSDVIDPARTPRAYNIFRQCRSTDWNFNPRSHKGSDGFEVYKTGEVVDFNPRSHKGSDSNFTQNSISVLFHFYQSFPHIIFPHTARFRLLIIFCTFFLVRIAQRFPVCFHFAPKQYPAFYNVCSTDLL